MPRAMPCARIGRQDKGPAAVCPDLSEAASATDLRRALRRPYVPS